MADEHEPAGQREAGRQVADQHDGQLDRRAGQGFVQQSDSWADKYRSRFASGARSRYSANGGSVSARNDDRLARGLSLRGRGAEDYERWDDRLQEIHKQLRVARSNAREQDADEGRRPLQGGRQGNGGTRAGKR